ncbi:MAG: TniQ family protein [Moraxellaceae bacterium]|nr:TniQ family protein [Moraxellaceae bacterium]
MASTYSWHPGANGLSSIWPVATHLMPDELFSGWVVRAALNQGCSLKTLITSIDGGLKYRDFDRGLSASQLDQLSKLSGIAADCFPSAMLSIVRNRLGVGKANRTIWPWVLPLGTQTPQKRRGIQFCPICWQSDRIVYQRLHWRFAWHTICDTHKVFLTDECYECGSAIHPHWLNQNEKKISTCSNCASDLSLTTPKKSLRGVMYQNLADVVLKSDTGVAWGETISASKWFRCLELIIVNLRSMLRESKAQFTIKLSRCGINVEDLVADCSPRSYELLNVEERNALFIISSEIMASSHSDMRAIFCGSDKAWPKPTWRPPISAKKYSPRSREEVDILMAKLLRTAGKHE